jgi:hypothetical protein
MASICQNTTVKEGDRNRLPELINSHDKERQKMKGRAFVSQSLRQTATFHFLPFFNLTTG